MSSSWKCLLCSRRQICIDTVLPAGQSFRWKQNSSGEWLGVMAGLVWRLKQSDDRILYQVYGSDSSSLFHERCGYQRINNSCQLVDQAPFLKTVDDNKTLDKIKSEVDIKEDPTKSSDTSKAESLDSVCRGKNKKHEKTVTTEHITQDKFCNLDTTDDVKHGRSCLVGHMLKHESSSLNSQKKEGQFSEPKNEVVTQSVSDGLHVDSTHQLLYDYLQLGVDLGSLYSLWSSRDAYFERVAGGFQGIRILRQDPTECLLSFVCSSNNHISRIASMVEKLSVHYGDLIACVDGVKYYTCPSLSALCRDGVESHLRELGFGYRAKFIASIARHVTQDKNEGWLESLRERTYTEARAELMTLLGVGAKVADCVCLMSLDKPEALPVDTHIWQITVKNYMAKLHSSKSLTDRLYAEIGDFYRNLWGPYAGWAQAVLFTADLRHNKDNSDQSACSLKNKDNSDQSACSLKNKDNSDQSACSLKKRKVGNVDKLIQSSQQKKMGRRRK